MFAWYIYRSSIGIIDEIVVVCFEWEIFLRNIFKRIQIYYFSATSTTTTTTVTISTINTTTESKQTASSMEINTIMLV